ncbi:MAG: lipocalin family protein [Chitinophagaceae bacterium]|nr:lipocalin family protein [Bacteroidota bacterium]MCC6257241.1 lipocalin family protein [Chitinophagaceae bacterium]MCW5916131.1 lipocalin family protein [Ferruginibacter sp.]
MKYPILFLLALICFLGSCSNSENAKNIIGHWQGTQWLVENRPGNYNADSTSFKFDEKGNYTFTYKSNVEAGTYKVENNMLFTRPAGEKEMMVYIEKLSGDTLQFKMDRGGVSELLTLLRQRK